MAFLFRRATRCFRSVSGGPPDASARARVQYCAAMDVVCLCSVQAKHLCSSVRVGGPGVLGYYIVLCCAAGADYLTVLIPAQQAGRQAAGGQAHSMSIACCVFCTLDSCLHRIPALLCAKHVLRYTSRAGTSSTGKIAARGRGGMWNAPIHSLLPLRSRFAAGLRPFLWSSATGTSTPFQQRRSLPSRPAATLRALYMPPIQGPRHTRVGPCSGCQSRPTALSTALSRNSGLAGRGVDGPAASQPRGVAADWPGLAAIGPHHSPTRRIAENKH
jgi:hypothetical protein